MARSGWHLLDRANTLEILVMAKLKDVAEAMMTLSYQDMIELGTSLRDIAQGRGETNEDDVREWADLMFVWAENYLEGQKENDG